jgi:DNA primase
MAPDSPAPDEREQRRQAGVLTAIADRETATLHDGRRPWAWWLERAAAYGQYGFTNTLLIAAQARFATQVRTYDQWKAQRRHVLKGEQGIRILSRTGNPRSVFDLAQTEGADPPEQPAGTPAQVWAELRRLAITRNFHVQRDNDYWHTAGPGDRLIRVDPDLADGDAVRVLAHQLGHAVLHADRIDVAGSAACHGVRRLEADSIAYLILAQLGVDPSGLVFPPLRSCAGTDPRARPLATITMVGDRILRTATRIRTHLATLPPPETPTKTPRNQRPEAIHLPAARPSADDSSMAEGTGASPPRPQGAGRPAEPSRDDLIAMHAAAHRFFLGQLPGSWAPGYLTGRGFDADVQRQWHIGYAPKAWRVLTDQLRNLGYSNDAIVASGLGRRGRSGRPYDTFRDRIMLPIRDIDGMVVGFIGRRPDQAPGPKYLNSPQTPIFCKSELLFGLAETHHALTAGARPVIVEGPLDAIAINTASPHHAALAPCGTTLTTAQFEAIHQVADLDTTGVLLALDADAAGRNAAVRYWEVLAQVKGPLGAVLLPEGLDPADLMRYQGCMAVRESLQSAPRLVDLVIDARMHQSGGPMEFTEQRWAAVRAAATVIGGLPPEQIGRQVARVARALDLEPGLVTNAVMTSVSPDTPSPFDVAADDFPVPPLSASSDACPQAVRGPADRQKNHSRTSRST